MIFEIFIGNIISYIVVIAFVVFLCKENLFEPKVKVQEQKQEKDKVSKAENAEKEEEIEITELVNPIVREREVDLSQEEKNDFEENMTGKIFDINDYIPETNPIIFEDLIETIELEQKSGPKLFDSLFKETPWEDDVKYYKDRFLRVSVLDSGDTVYSVLINRENYEIIQKFLSVFEDEGITISDYVNNILKCHIEWSKSEMSVLHFNKSFDLMYYKTCKQN